MSTKMQQNQIIEWHKAKVMMYPSEGESNQSKIAKIIQIHLRIVNRDLIYHDKRKGR
jgi:hypothetical protein